MRTGRLPCKPVHSSIICMLGPLLLYIKLLIGGHLLQVVNLKEARDFSNDKNFIYVFKVNFHRYLLYKMVLLLLFL